MDLTNASAIVTGGADGLVSATVRGLAQMGAKVAIADVSDERGEALATEVEHAEAQGATRRPTTGALNGPAEVGGPEGPPTSTSDLWFVEVVDRKLLAIRGARKRLVA
jgi:NAD(P)-dependent dehydrogenase (short-subunit alcohol dehydrogenase family)